MWRQSHRRLNEVKETYAMAITADDLTRQIGLLRSDPGKYLDLADEFIRQNPSDPYGYFKRHQIHKALGQPALALADITRAVGLAPTCGYFEDHGWMQRDLGQYQKAIEDFDRAEALDPEEWADGFGHLIRAECHARLGNERAALVDCAKLRDDHWTPGPFGLPAGNKHEVAVELRRLAAAARQSRS